MPVDEQSGKILEKLAAANGQPVLRTVLAESVCGNFTPESQKMAINAIRRLQLQLQYVDAGHPFYGHTVKRFSTITGTQVENRDAKSDSYILIKPIAAEDNLQAAPQLLINFRDAGKEQTDMGWFVLNDGFDKDDGFNKDHSNIVLGKKSEVFGLRETFILKRLFQSVGQEVSVNEFNSNKELKLDSFRLYQLVEQIRRKLTNLDPNWDDIIIGTVSSKSYRMRAYPLWLMGATAKPSAPPQPPAA